MVNALEALYALTALALGAALVQLMRQRQASARRFGMAAAIGAVVGVFLYWILSSAA